MDTLFLANLSSPPLLFFFLGAAAAWLRSDLEIPTQIARFLSLYLLLAIGFKGGVALAENPPDLDVVTVLGVAVALASLIPVYVFLLLKRRASIADAAAVAATYGSVSAVTFVTATSYLDAAAIPWSGYLVAAMALMESPAIIVGLLLYQLFRNGNGQETGAVNWQELLRESLLNGSVFLLIGSMLIGWVTGPQGMAQIGGFIGDLFIGILCLFLLDMGIVAARRLQEFRAIDRKRVPEQTAKPEMKPGTIVALALLLPLMNGIAGCSIALLLGLPEGDALLLTVLAASASYIAVPAAMRLALPEANPGLYLPMSLALTFPLNLLLGIPGYHLAIRWLMAP